MTKKTRKGREKMLVLGFDAGCGTCAEIAGRVEERAGDALAVRNLADPEVMGWREEALGPDAPWAPTLFEIEGDNVRAWTGKGMALPLSRKLGLSNTWQLMQALGEMPNAGIQTVDAAPAGAGISRSKFLKGVGGAAVAMSVLSGAGPLASIAQAAETSPLDIVKTIPIKGRELGSLSRRIALNADMRGIAGNALNTSAKIAAAKPVAARQKLRNGTFVTIIAYNAASNRVLTHATYSRPVGRGATSIAKILARDSKNKFTIVKVSEGGRLWRRPASAARLDAAAVQTLPLGECPVETGASGTPRCAVYYTRECLSWDYSLGCFADAGVNFGFSCGGCAAALFSYSKGKGEGKSAQAGCTACLYSTSPNNLEGCARCRAPMTVKRIDYSRC